MRLDTQKQHELARAVAAELGWTTTPAKNWGGDDAPILLAGPDGQQLWIDTEWNDSTKVYIHGEYPRGPKNEDLTPYHAVKPSISVSLKRGAAIIAKEISRRLLPQYTELLQVMQSLRQSAVDYLNIKSNAAAKLSTVLGPLVKAKTDINGNPIEGALEFRYRANISGVITCNSTSNPRFYPCHLDLDVSHELALKIAQTIADHFAENNLHDGLTTS